MAEHSHSCCTLLAQKKFRVNGVWHTWIDFDKFAALVQKVVQMGVLFFGVGGGRCPAVMGAVPLTLALR
jgi:hypothetical protein